MADLDAARVVLHVRRTACDRPVRDPRPGSPDRPRRRAWSRGDTRRPRIRRAHRARTDRTGPDRNRRIGTARALEPGVAERVFLDRGTVALDGEREIEFSPGDRVRVTLARDGPRVIDVPALLAQHADITTQSLSTT